MRQLLRSGRNLWRHRTFRWLATICVAALAGIAGGRTVIGSLGSLSVVEGESMAPTYATGARIYTVPVTTPLRRGDIVLVDDGHKEYALKRIVGLPGETVQLWRGYVFVNRRLLRETYLPRFTYTFADERTGTSRFQLESGQYWVLGDNRNCSVDSRRYGPVDLDHIKTRVPQPALASGAYLEAYTLPAEGKRTIQPLSQL